MSKIDTSSWKEFKISDLFEIVNGKKYPKSNRESGNLPLISTSSFNNGISDYIAEREDNVYKNIITVAYSGSVGATFYHKNNVFIGETVLGLIPKFRINEEIGLFFVNILSIINKKYSYDHKIKVLSYGDEYIKLPVKETEEIDFDYMESYVKNLEEVHVKNLEEVHVKNLYNYLKVADLENTELTDEEKDALTRKVNYKEFKVKDLFEVENTFSYNMDSLVTGNDYDYITRTVLNNGICRTTNYISSKGINEKNVFSLELMNMTFFYREKEWYAGQFIRKVKFKYELNTLRALYLQSLLKPISKVLKSVLIRNVDDTFLNLSIYLPVKLNGEIDFDYMETYIKALEKLTIQKIYDDETLFINKTKEIIAE